MDHAAAHIAIRHGHEITPTPDPHQALDRCRCCNAKVVVVDLVYRREVVHIGTELPATCTEYGHLLETTGNIHYAKIGADA